MITSPWSEAQDAMLRRLRAEGASWDDISAAVGRVVSACMDRSRTIGAARPAPTALDTMLIEPTDDTRLPLPPGHPRSWGVLTRGTVLEGATYG